MSGGEVGSYQELAFDPLYYETPCPVCGGVVESEPGRYTCGDCDWEAERE